MDKGAIEDYDHVTLRDEKYELDETNTFAVNFSLNFRAPICTSNLVILFQKY